MNTRTRASLRQQAYEHIHRRILGGELPSGSMLSEPSLAREIGISRTPVREALGQLQAEGLVEVLPQRGTAVRSVNREELGELYEMREALESFAAGRAAERVGREELRELRSCCEQMRAMAGELRRSGQRALNAERMRRYILIDMGFHMAIIRAAGNRRIAKQVADSRLLIRVFTLPRQAHDRAILAEALRYHTGILRALRDRDAEGARRIMAEHIRTAMRHALAHYDRHVSMGGVIPMGLPQEQMGMGGGELALEGGAGTAAAG